MKRTILLATTALVALAIPALADGKGGKRLTGLGDIGYTYIDVDSVFGDSVSNFHGIGSALWTWPDKWNAQANFDFNSFHQDPFGASVWRLGGAGFWRDVNEGMLGGQLHYQSIDGGIGYADGVEIRGRGELFLSEATIGAHLGYWHGMARSFDAHRAKINRNDVKRGLRAAVDGAGSASDQAVRPEFLHQIGEQSQRPAST